MSGLELNCTVGDIFLMRYYLITLAGGLLSDAASRARSCLEARKVDHSDDS